MKMAVTMLIVLTMVFSVVHTALAGLSDGLVAYYPFNGNANDESGNGNHGTLLPVGDGPTLTEDRCGYPNSAYSFDGNDDYIHLGNDSSLNPTDAISLAAWYRPQSFTGVGNNAIIDKGFYSHTSPFYQYHLGVTGDNYVNTLGEFVFNVTGDGQLNYVGTDPNYWEAGNWYHVVGTYDGSCVKFYVNGKLIDSENASGAMVDYGTSAYIGTFANYYSFTPGAIDEVRIYNRALSETEIQQLADWPATISPGGNNFGIIAIDCISTQLFTVTNVSETKLELSSLSLTGMDASEFDIQNDTCSEQTLLLSGTCTFDVVFEPKSLGLKVTTVNIPFTDLTDHAIETLEVPLSGLATPVCEGDFNSDHDVDGSDLSVFAADFGRTNCDTEPPCEGNFDSDNDVDGSDLAKFAADFGRTDCPICP